MDINLDDYRTPGQLIEALLEKKGWTKRVLAIVTGVDETGLNHRLSSKRPIVADFAISLEEVFGVPADYFLELQKRYDLAKARVTSKPDKGRSTRVYIFDGLPVSEMIKRRWLETEDIRDMSSIEKSITKFFGATSLDQIEILPHAAKKTMVSEGTTPAQLAWLYRVKEIAREMIVGKYSNHAVHEAIELLRPMLISDQALAKVPRILSECGIRFVIVESLPASKIDGVCFWLNDSAPVIGMTLRFDRIDNFWFVLRHELEHVLQQHGKSVIAIDSEIQNESAGNETAVAEEEKLANLAAAEFCVPQKKMDSFIAKKAPLFSERDILGMAATLKIHPGLIAGQLQHRIDRYDLFKSHLVKIRSIVCPSAVVDGWGDVAQVNR